MLIQQLEEKSRLGKILVKRQYISEHELTEALVYQATHKVRIGEALMALELITPLQLKRALRRQNWLRTFAAGVALVVTPFTPALAAGNGTLGSSSSATSHITLTIAPKSQAQGKGELKFTSNNQATESGFCTSEFDADLFRVKLSGSGENGNFKVSNGHQNPLSYQVSYKHQQQAFQALQANQPSQVYSNLAVEKRCKNAYSNQLQVAFAEHPSAANSVTPYNGVLTLTVAAE